MFRVGTSQTTEIYRIYSTQTNVLELASFFSNLGDRICLLDRPNSAWTPQRLFPRNVADGVLIYAALGSLDVV